MDWGPRALALPSERSGCSLGVVEIAKYFVGEGFELAVQSVGAVVSSLALAVTVARVPLWGFGRGKGLASCFGYRG